MNMNRLIAAGCLSMMAVCAGAEDLRVDSFLYYGPCMLPAPLMIDSVDVNGRQPAAASLFASPEILNPKGTPSAFSGDFAPSADATALHTLVFDFENASYATPTLEVAGIKDYTVYLDGRKTEGDRLTLRPSTHRLALRYVTAPGVVADSLRVVLKSDGDAGFSLRGDGKRRFTLLDVLHGTNVVGTQVSPDGKYAIVSYSTTLPGGETSFANKIIQLSDGRVVAEPEGNIGWLAGGSEYYSVRDGARGRELTAVDVASGRRRKICAGIPEGSIAGLTPDGKSVILATTQEGRREDAGVYEVLEPEDRQPGWRTRAGISLFDIESGVARPLTFGHRNAFLNDISDDSRRLLLSVSESRLEKRPTTLNSLYLLDLATMKADTLVSRDGFVSHALLSPDMKSVLIIGSPEALGGVGRNVPEGRIPSMTDNQMFIMDIATRETRPVTKDFNPSVGEVKWSRGDGMVYFTAEDRDHVSLFRLDPDSGKITAIATPEEMVKGFSVADSGRALVWFGESASSPRAMYSMDTKTLKSTRLESPKEEGLRDVQLGACEAWDFVNSNGDTINGRFYLPPDFDTAKKYPLIVNYYGGCSPTGRNFESRYPHHAYAAQGYVVYVLNPSGATGYGQEFSSRHVNTAGEGVARDIIEGTKRFCEEHPYVDEKKIGCIGASYGGFMTQYLQTVTDIFAAAISHAGISDHTSYWGEGYWGYSYSEVSMAESYPWSDRDLYVDHSPLYNADKVHTPLLFLHGDKDNNVPVGESIQMFTALKLLGRPTAFVAVADQDHHILDYDKRIKWQDTIFAWFARYLKDDPSWWEALYPSTPLSK